MGTSQVLSTEPGPEHVEKGRVLLLLLKGYCIVLKMRDVKHFVCFETTQIPWLIDYSLESPQGMGPSTLRGGVLREARHYSG